MWLGQVAVEVKDLSECNNGFTNHNGNENENTLIAKIMQRKSAYHTSTWFNFKGNNWREAQWNHNFDNEGRSDDLCAPSSIKRQILTSAR